MAPAGQGTRQGIKKRLEGQLQTKGKVIQIDGAQWCAAIFLLEPDLEAILKAHRIQRDEELFYNRVEWQTFDVPQVLRTVDLPQEAEIDGPETKAGPMPRKLEWDLVHRIQSCLGHHSPYGLVLASSVTSDVIRSVTVRRMGSFEENPPIRCRVMIAENRY